MLKLPLVAQNNALGRVSRGALVGELIARGLSFGGLQFTYDVQGVGDCMMQAKLALYLKLDSACLFT